MFGNPPTFRQKTAVWVIFWFLKMSENTVRKINESCGRRKRQGLRFLGSLKRSIFSIYENGMFKQFKNCILLEPQGGRRFSASGRVFLPPTSKTGVFAFRIKADGEWEGEPLFDTIPPHPKNRRMPNAARLRAGFCRVGGCEFSIWRFCAGGESLN